MNYKVSKGKALYLTVVNPENRETEDYLVGPNDNVDLKIEDNTLFVMGTDGKWYLTDNTPEHAISNKLIEEVK